MKRTQTNLSQLNAEATALVQGTQTADVPFVGKINTGDIDDEYMGDPDDEEDMGDVTVGDLEIGDVDADDDASYGEASIGEVIKKRLRRVKNKSSIRLATSRNVHSPAVAVAAQVARITKDTGLSLPGVALDGSMYTPIFPANAKLATAGTTRKISGFVLAHNIKDMLCRCVWRTVYSQVVSTGSSLTVKFGGVGSTPPAPAKVIYAPIVFITITSNLMSSQAGSRLTMSVNGVNPDGVAIANDQWVFNRGKLNAPISIAYVPYIRVADSLTPANASIYGVIPAYSPDPTEFSVTIDGLAKDEQCQVLLPGLDSNELKDFLKAFNLKM